MPNKELQTHHVYWDSCVFIALMSREAPRIDLLEEIEEAAIRKQILVVTSAIAVVEVQKTSKRVKGGSPADARKLRAFFDNEWIVIRPLDRSIAQAAAVLSQKHRLKCADAVHLATAIYNNKNKIKELHTYDPHLLKLDRIVSPKSFRIIPPRHHKPTPLFDKSS